MNWCRVNFKPLSQGRIWSTGKHGKRFLTTEGKDFKRMIAMLSRSHFPFMMDYQGKKFFECRFGGKWYTQKGVISKTAGDLDNFNKLILDGISEGMGFNDSQFFRISTEKVDAEEFYFEFSIGSL